MPRPRIARNIGFVPAVYCFKPLGVPASELQTVVLELEEIEALRLSDLQEKYQEDCALEMGISRQSFALIVKRARKKVADALLTGKKLIIETNPKSGDLVSRRGHRRCPSCSKSLDDPSTESDPTENEK